MTTATMTDWTPTTMNTTRIDRARYWVGAGLTAIIAGLAGVVGMIVAHSIAHVPVLFGDGTSLVPVHAAAYGLITAVIVLAVAALYDGMLRVAPRPSTYYGWLIGLLTVLATILPFTTTAALHSQIAFGALNLLVGMIVLLLVPLAAVYARVERARQP